MDNSIEVVLVGATPTGAECLGLEYVAGALREAGHRPVILAFRGWHELEVTARQVLQQNPPLVGISIPSGIAAIDALSLAHRIRTLGYAGHITCGGTFATLARKRLLHRYPALDSVVRHDGEIPMARLADALATGADVSTVAGVTTGDGDGLPAPVFETGHLRKHLRSQSTGMLYAGVPSAKISAVRGCFGTCRYCGLRGLRKEARREARACGLSQNEISQLGIGGMRRRPVETVADEMSSLYHDQGVRFFHIVDENFLPKDQTEALKAIRDLDRELSRRKVGKRAISMMIRADAASADVVKALERLGVVRCLLGVESTSREGLAALGRSGHPRVNIEAMDHLCSAGVSFHFNLLLIHPTSTLADIERELRGLAEVRGGLIDPFQVEAFEGTEFFERLKKQDRLEGGPILWHWWPEETAARRFAEIFYRIKRDALGFVQMTSYAYEVLGTYRVARHLGLISGRHGPSLDTLANNLVEAHNALWLSLLNQASILARNNASKDEIREFIANSQYGSAHLTLRFRNLKERCDRLASQPLTSEVFYPLTAGAVAIALSILSGCSGGDPATRDSGLDASDADMDSVSDTFSDTDPDSNPDSDQPDSDTDPDADIDADFDADPDVDPDVDLDGDISCDGFNPWTWSDSVVDDAMRSGCQDICDLGTDEFRYRFVVNPKGEVIDIVRADGVPIPDEIKNCYLATLTDQVFPCVDEGEEYWVFCHVLLA